jgi:predicted SnoaL-like aldol condensation-catalyzing enzyme
MKSLTVSMLSLCLLGLNAAQAEQSPRAVVLGFYKLALSDMKPRAAFAQYAAPNFVEHSADSAGGTTNSTVTFLEGLIKWSPQPKWAVVRTIAEGDLVFLHVRFTASPKATPIVVGEIFRVKNGKLAEHWDIIQHAPEKPVNPNPIL